MSIEDESYAKLSVGGLEELSALNEHKVLGQNWNTINDTFIYKLDILAEFAKNLEATKRNVLKVVAKIYDPMGILGPLIVTMKIFFQNICINNFSWDSPLPDHLKRRWKNWTTDLQKTRHIIISRCIYDVIVEEIISYSLHSFGDASSKAFCGVVYIVMETNSSSYVRLLGSKTRVAPLVKHSIPRLELLSALIVARLFFSIKEALQSLISFDSCNLCLDSITIFLLTGLRIYTGEYKAQGPTLCPTEGRALRGPRALYSPV